MGNKLIEAIERKCFAEISVIAFEKIFNGSLKNSMVDDHLSHGRLSDKTIKLIEEKFK